MMDIRKKPLLCCSLTILVYLTASHADVNAIQRLSRAHFEFTLDLYHELALKNGGNENILFSPYSITVILSMLFLSMEASSPASKQIREVLHYRNISFNEVHKAFRDVVANFEEDYYTALVLFGNAMFRQKGISVSEYYLRALKGFYHSDFIQVDFYNSKEAEDYVNDWVHQKTMGKIPKILDRSPDPETKLMLVNAIWFKGSWSNKFDPRATFDKGLFFVTPQRRLEIPMMIGKFELPLGYNRELECRILELPFTEKRMSMFILLPDDMERGLMYLEKNLTSDNLKALFSTLKDEVVNLRLPRFRLQQDSDLEEDLKQLGLGDIFIPKKADLSGMSESSDLFVSNIFHHATLEVTEEGAEGAAATATGVERLGTFGDKYFEVDHPFLFLIWDYYSGMMMFMGRVMTPLPA